MREALLGGAGGVGVIVLFILRTEYPDWGQRLASLLVRWAAWGLLEPDRSTSREEWEAELAAVLDETDKSCTGLTYAGWLAARYGWRTPMRFAAETLGRLRRRRVRRSLARVDLFWLNDDGSGVVVQLKTCTTAEDWRDGDLVL